MTSDRGRTGDRRLGSNAGERLPGRPRRCPGPVTASLLPLALLVASVALAPAVAAAQETTASGTVDDATEPETAVLHGSIRFAASGEPVPQAEIRVVGTGVSDRSDPDGDFRLEGVPPGEHELVVSYLQDSAPGVAVRLEPGAEERIGIDLYEKVVPVEELRVEVSAGEEGGRLSGFRRRRAEGRGDFYTRQMIARVGGTRLSTVVRQSSGLDVRPCRGAGGVTDDCFHVSSSRGPTAGGRCVPTLRVDGARVSPEILGERFGVIQKRDVLAMEIYDGPALTPLRFQSSQGGRCGAIVIWTGRS